MTFKNTEFHIFLNADEEFVSGYANRVQLSPDGVRFPQHLLIWSTLS